MMYKNQEGYADPTAGQALANIRREEKARLGYMPLVYICSPFRGDVENNMRNARKYCAFALSRHALPIATHLLFPQFMGTKETPQTREMALHMALILLTHCNELWYFGDTVSEGMKKEISRALAQYPCAPLYRGLQGGRSSCMKFMRKSVRSSAEP